MRNTATKAIPYSLGAASGQGSFHGRRHPMLTAVLFLAVGQIALAQNAVHTKPAASNKTDSSPSRSTQDASLPVPPEKYGNLPLSFAANQGQADQGVKFLANSQGYGIYLTANEAVLTLNKPASRIGGKVDMLRTPEGRRPMAHRVGSLDKNLAKTSLASLETGGTETDTVRMKLQGANPQATVSGTDTLPGTMNYFLGRDPSKWRSGVPTYANVRYTGVYPGVDLIYYGNQRHLEYDFVVAPKASAKVIRLQFTGVDKLKLNADGDLSLMADHGEIVFRKPSVYQEEDGRRRPVAGRFTMLTGNTVGFQVGHYNHSEPLVIDPELTYVTYLGGTGADDGQAIAVDASGAAFLTGSTNSNNFPITAGSSQTGISDSGAPVAYITKFSADGSTLEFSTYLGGSGGDYGNGIAIDASGNAYVTGYTYSSDFPVSGGAYQAANKAADAGLSNVFVAKLNNSGSALLYATYLGGNGNIEAKSGDFGESIAVDTGGNAYLTGYAYSINFPVSDGAYQSTNNAAGNNGQAAFITKLNPTGSALVYSTYLGGSGSMNGLSLGPGDLGEALAIDPTGDVYVAGAAGSANFPTTTGAFQTVNNSTESELFCYNGFVTELNPTGTALVYSTYLGGSGTFVDSGGGVEYCDQAYALALNSAGNAYVTGSTGSSDFPFTDGSLQTTNKEIGAGYFTGFVTSLNVSGSALIYSTYLGGAGSTDASSAIAIDASGDAYVVGSTLAANFPVTGDAYQTGNGDAAKGNPSAFLSELNPTGSALVYSTYLGGSGGDEGNGVALDSGANPYLTGVTASTDFPVSVPAYQSTNLSTGGTAFVAKLGIGTPLVPTKPTTLSLTAAPPATSVFGQSVTLTAVLAPFATASFTTNGETITFQVNGTTLGTGTLNAGVATLVTAALPVGADTITASYVGDAIFEPSAQTLAYTVSPVISTPTIATLTPNSAYVGSASTTVTINGTQFLTGAAVTVDGTTQAATFVSATQLTTALTAAQLSTVGTLSLAVVNPDGGTSNAVPFTVLQFPLQLSPAALAFGNQTVGTSTAAQVVTLTNTTGAPITITTITLDLGLNPGDFAQTNNCPATIGAGANCQITITFTPGGVGPKSAGLAVSDSTSLPNESVNMTGTGTGGILQVNPGNLKTIAGNGTAGYTGDGGAATAAELNDPDGVNFDAEGNLYIADVVNNVIRKVDTAGNITTVAGNGTAGFSGDGGPATAAQLHGPFGVTPDAAGNLYIQDTLNARIRRVDATTGIITTIAGNGTFGLSGDGGPATAAEVAEVQGSRFDKAGNLYVAQCGPAAIRKIDTAGIITTVAGTGIDGFSGDGGPATSAQLNCASGVAVDAAGELFIADYLNYRVRKVNAAGIITTIAGNGTPGFTGDGGPALAAEINLPNDVDVDAAGDVYIADSGNNRLRKIDTTGVITTVVGGLNNAGSAGVNAPSAVAFDTAGNAYFSDSGNNAIREVFPAGAIAFPTTPIGTAAANETVSLSNIGNLPVTIASEASFGLSGNTTDFSLAGGTCLAGATLAANGGSCTLQIGFTPTATGTRTLTVSITDDAVYSPQSFSISGVGTTALPVVLSAIAPAGAIAGAADTTITATGANFTPTSVVVFNAAPLVTTYVSATQLTAVVPAAQLTTTGTASIIVTDPYSGTTSTPDVFTILPGTPAVTFSAPTANPGDQPTLNFAVTEPYPAPITGTMTLTFAPDTGNPDNPQVQLASASDGVVVAPGGRTLTFPLAANSTVTPVVMVQVGNVAGTITITLQLTAAGVNVTPSDIVPITIVVAKTAPTITALSFTTSGDTLTVLVTGFSTTREIQSATFDFTPASGASLNTKTITIPASSLFTTWYNTAGSALYGSAFTYTQLFTLSGDASAVAGIGATLTNTVGTSTEVTAP